MLDAFNHLVDILDLPGFFVINLDVEFAFEIKENVQAVQRIDPKGFETAVDV
jgi:hypothetical protein